MCRDGAVKQKVVEPRIRVRHFAAGRGEQAAHVEHALRSIRMRQVAGDIFHNFAEGRIRRVGSLLGGGDVLLQSRVNRVV